MERSLDAYPLSAANLRRALELAVVLGRARLDVLDVDVVSDRARAAALEIAAAVSFDPTPALRSWLVADEFQTPRTSPALHRERGHLARSAAEPHPGPARRDGKPRVETHRAGNVWEAALELWMPDAYKDPLWAHLDRRNHLGI